MLDQRLGMTTEIGRHLGAVALGEKAFAEQDDDGHRASEQRNAHEGKLEETELTDAGLESGLRDEDVHRRAGQRKHRSRMGGKDERHQELRRFPLETNRHDDHDRQQSGNRAVDADHGGQHGHEAHGEKEKARPALLPRAPDQELTGPGGDAGRLETGADDEEAGDEDDGGVAEAAQCLAQGENASPTGPTPSPWRR